MSKQTISTKELLEPTRLDHFLPEVLGESRSKVLKLIKHKRVLVNGEPSKKGGVFVTAADSIELLPKEEVFVKVEFPDIEIVSETDQYLVINKPAGMLVHPTEAEESDTLANWLVKTFPELEGVGENPVRPGIVHRLDREASGLLVVARTQDMFLHLKKQFKARTVQKEYKVLVYGNFETETGVIDFDIARGKDGRMTARPKTDFLKLKNATIEKKGKEALTEYVVEQDFPRFSLLRVKIHTGRTHQIRVHCFATDHPVVGDTLYVNNKLSKKHDAVLDRLFLHAFKLGFTDLHGEDKVFQIELPQDLQDYLKLLQ